MMLKALPPESTKYFLELETSTRLVMSLRLPLVAAAAKAPWPTRFPTMCSGRGQNTSRPDPRTSRACQGASSPACPPFLLLLVPQLHVEGGHCLLQLLVLLGVCCHCMPPGTWPCTGTGFWQIAGCQPERPSPWSSTTPGPHGHDFC